MRFFKGLICKIVDHDYPSECFSCNDLYFCVRCGKEILDGTIDDLVDMEPVSSEELEEIISGDRDC